MRDYNTFGLGFFNAIHIFRYKNTPRNVEMLFNASENAFCDLNKQKVTDVFVTVRKVMACSVRNENLYVFLHLVKEFPKTKASP